MQQDHSGTGHNINARQVYIESTPKLFSELTNVINVLSKRLYFEDGAEKNVYNAFNPEAKISHNNLVTFKEVINEYKIYGGKLSSVYREFDQQGTNKTHIVLENIKLAYIREKGFLLRCHPGVPEIEVIRKNSDLLVQNVEETLLLQIRESLNIETSSEYINVSLQIILIDAFIRCKILEEPN